MTVRADSLQNSFVETFRHEADELLVEIEQSALSMSSGSGGLETVNQLFRAFHTIKGSGGMLGFDRLAAFTHHVENLLDRVRSGAVPISRALVDQILKSADHIKLLLQAELGGEGPPPGSSDLLIAAGATAWIVKPFRPDQLLSVVKKIIGC